MNDKLSLGIFGSSQKTGKMFEAIKQVSALNRQSFDYIRDEKRTAECDIILLLLRPGNLAFDFEDEYVHDVEYYNYLIQNTSAQIIFLIDSDFSSDENYNFIHEQIVPYVMYSIGDLDFETMELSSRFHYMFYNFDELLSRNTNYAGQWTKFLDSLQHPEKIKKAANKRLFNLAKYLLQYNKTTSLLSSARSIFVYLAANSDSPSIKEQSYEILKSNYIQECLEKIGDDEIPEAKEHIEEQDESDIAESKNVIKENIDKTSDSRITGVLKIRKKLGY